MKTAITFAHLGASLLMFAGYLQAGGKEPAVPLEKMVQPADDLPLPFGLSVFYAYQEQDYRLKNLEADLPKLTPPKITKLPPGTIPAGLPAPYAAAAEAAALKAAQEIANKAFADQIAQIPKFDRNAIRSVRNKVHHVNATLDWWALPMLNFHVLYGQFEGTAEAELSPELSRLFDDISVDYHGQSYGGGLTLAAGWRRFFATATLDYTWSDVDMKDGSALKLEDPDGIGTLVFQPKIGCRFSDLSVWIGAQYQKTEHTQAGTFEVAQLGKVPFRAEVEDEHHWNWLAGIEWRLSRHWSLIAEGGFGQRRQALAGLTFRF